MPQHEEMSPAERDLRTLMLNSSSTVKALAGIAAKLEEVNPRRSDPGGFNSGAEFLAVLRQQMTNSVSDPRLMVNTVSTYGGQSVGADGGYLAAPAWSDEVLLPVLGSGSLLGAFNPMITTSNLVVIGVDETSEWSSSGITASIVEEGAATTASKGVLQKRNVHLHKVSALKHASNEIVDDSGGYVRYVWSALGRKVRNKVESLVMRGTGANEPLGLLNSPARVTVTPTTSNAATLGKEDVEAMVGRLLPGSFPTAIWVAHSTALVRILDLPSSLYNPNGPSPFGYGTLVGRPIAVTEHANPYGQVGDVVLVDPAGYFFAVKGPRNVATIEFAFDQGLESFRSSIRIGGVPLLSAPVARRTGSDTFSHVVVLGERS